MQLNAIVTGSAVSWENERNRDTVNDRTVLADELPDPHFARVAVIQVAFLG